MAFRKFTILVSATLLLFSSVAMSAEKHGIKLNAGRPDPAEFSSKAVESKGRFEKYASGVVYDSQTNLQWYSGPNKPTTLKTARSWVANLKVAGGGWRMPTEMELDTLYERNSGYRNISPLFNMHGWLVWCEGKQRSTQCFFNFFGYGSEHRNGDLAHFRAFAVRSRR